MALDAGEDLHHFAHQSWRTENGLPQNTIHAILQTRQGYVWLATEGGVVRFDGIRFVVYDRQNTPELTSNNIRALAEGSDGALWVASGDGLVRLKGAADNKRFTTRDGLPNNNVWAVHVDREGGLWAATTNGLAHFANDRFEAVADNIGPISALAVSRRGSLSLATADGLKILRNSSFQNASPALQPLKTAVEVLLSDSSNRLWMGTARGLWMQSGTTATLYTTHNGLPSDRITALYEDREQSVWVGTDSGAARIASGRIERFVPGETLAGDMVLSFYEDAEGDLWAGTDAGGVTILRQPKFTTYSGAENALQDLVRCVFQDHSGAVWFGTSGHGLRRFAGAKFTEITTSDGLASDQVFALAEDRDGSLLVGTPDGLNRVRNGVVSLLTSADGLADDFVRSIFRDGDGSLWIGTRRGLSHLKDGRFETYTQRDGLGSDLVGAVLRDRFGRLWIGTRNGLSLQENGKITNFTSKDGLSSDVITALGEDEQGNLWIGTEDGGLNRFRTGRFTQYRSQLGLPQAIYGIADDTQGNLWLAASTGVYRADERELNRWAERTAGRPTVIPYGTSDGLKISECTGGGHPAIWRGKNGALWFATPKGAAELRTDDAKISRVVPPVVIESVSVDDERLDPKSIKDVRPGHSRFSFEYAGLSFSAPQKVRFRYKLEGFDRDWVDAGTRRVAYYTNIPAGHFRFRVLARNADGIWNENGATLGFRLLPHFYQTYWFAALILGVLCLFAYGIYHWRVKEVEARFNAVLEERNRIAREIHDTLAQGFVAVSVQLELVARLLTASTENAKEHLNQARMMVRDSLSEARSAIWELRSQTEGSEDLAARLSKMAGQVTASSSVKLRLDVHGTYRPLARVVEDELVRIGQEAVTNAVRHANAGQIQIELVFERKKVKMTIADDGCGFSVNSSGRGPAGHFGLQGMRERAERIDADLTVVSAPGEGTRVSLETEAA